MQSLFTNCMEYFQSTEVFWCFVLCLELQLFSLLTVSKESKKMFMSALAGLREVSVTLNPCVELCRGGTTNGAALIWMVSALAAWCTNAISMTTVGYRLHNSEILLMFSVGPSMSTTDECCTVETLLQLTKALRFGSSLWILVLGVRGQRVHPKCEAFRFLYAYILILTTTRL